MFLFFISLIILGKNRLIIDTQTQITGILAFQSQEQDISLWFRSQPSFIQEMKVDLPVLFAIIQAHDGNILSSLSYTQEEKDLSMYIEIQNQRLQIFEHKFDTDYIDFTWIRLLIHKTTEKIDYIQIDDKKMLLQNLYQRQLNMLYSWPSKLFSCIIYDSVVESKEENVLLLQSDQFFKSQDIFKRDQTFMIIQDQNWIIQFSFNMTDIIINFNYGYYKSFRKSFDPDMTDQWIKITIFNELDHITSQIAFKEKQFESEVYQKFDNYNQVANQNLFLPLDIFVAKYLQNYQIYVINKYQDNQIVNLDKFCFQNCKICNQLQCIECEGYLSLQSNCQCPYNQYLNSKLGICVDKMHSQQEQIHNISQPTFCPFGQYYDQQQRQCLLCPKLNEFQCTSCLYNTDIWQSNRICEFQDILQQAFITFHTSLFISLQFKSKDLKILNEFIIQYQQQYNGESIILVFFKDIYLIMQGFCEQNYFYDKRFNKCKILQKGQQYGYFLDNIYSRLCKMGYIFVYGQCIKCSKNCLFCKYSKHKLVCILPIKSYFINEIKQIKKCEDEQCQQIVKYNQTECSIDNCLVCYFGSCLICNSRYVKDSGEYCIIGSQLSLFFAIEINDNLIKPQIDDFQMLYLKDQLEKFKLELTSEDLIQLMVFGNNYKAMRDFTHKPQIIRFYDDFQLIQCKNQTQYFKFKFCHQPVSGYQYIQQQDKYAYCHQENCLFDLIFEVVIHFSNNPSILYKNRTYNDFDNFVQSISTTDLYIRNIFIKAIVYVFETPQTLCENPHFFLISNQNIINIKVLLDFKGVSVFPQCKSPIRIEIQEIQFQNLFTSSSIRINVNSDKISFRNCTFRYQENILFNLKSRKIYFHQTYIQGIKKNQQHPIFNISHKQLIEELVILDLCFQNIILQQQKMIIIWNKINYINIKNITLIDNQFIEHSTFISLKEAINLRINLFSIDNMIFEKSGLIIFETNQQILLTIYNLIFQNSELIRQSVLFQSSNIKLRNIQFQNVKMWDSMIVFSNQNQSIHNIQLVNMNIFQAQILQFYGKNFILVNFYISNSSLINSDSLIQIYTLHFLIRFLYFTNCSYFPNLRILNIQGMIGSVYQLMIRNVTNDTGSQQFNIGDNYASDMIRINANIVLVQQLYFFSLLNPHPLLNIKYDRLQLDSITLEEIKLIQINKYEQFFLIKYLIQIQSNNWENTFCLLQNIKANHIILQNELNSQLDSQSKLSLMNLLGGQIQVYNLEIDILLSQQQINLFNAFQLQIRLYNMKLNHLLNFGILLFSCSQVQYRNIYYQTNYSYQTIVPLFKNDDLLSKNNMIMIQNIQVINLSTPLIQIKSNHSFKIVLINVLIEPNNIKDDLISAQLSNQTLGDLQIFQMKISNQQSDNLKQLYLLSINNMKTTLNFIYLRNINFGVCDCISNGTINQNIFSFQNYSDTVSIINLIINNITQSKFAIIKFNLGNGSKIILESLLIYKFKGDTLINYGETSINQKRVALRNVRVDQSYFSHSIFSFLSLSPIQFDINGLLIYKVKCGIFLFTNQKDITINDSIIIDVYSFEIISKKEIQFISSQIYQTNILNKQTKSQSEQLDKQLSSQEIIPISLSFHGKAAFKQTKLDNIFNVQLSQKNKSVYVPSGQQFKHFNYFNLQTMEHEQIYKSFSILINTQAFRQTEEIQCSLKQSLDGIWIGNYSNYQHFNLSNGLNTFDDFMFIMNPYTNYSFLQNDIICDNYTLSFYVKILPCQLGEYLYQNKCITCDTNKNLYSIIRKAQYCQIINPEYIQELKIGRVKLQQNYWKPSLTSNLIEKCEIDQVCLGGWMNGDLSCNSSRVGALCKECDIYNTKGEGQFVQSGQKCLECKPNLLLFLKGFCIFLWIIFITFMNYNTNKKITENVFGYSDEVIYRLFSIIIKIYTNYIFIMYLVQENLQFLNNEILLVLNFISNPGIIITTELDCILVNLTDIDIQYLQLAQSLIQPILVLSLVYFIYVALIALRVQRYHFNLIIIITYSVYLFNQQIIIQNQIKLLSYKMISGIKWIYSNQQFQFYAQKHFHMIATFIAPTTLIILVIPILIFFLLKFRDKQSIWCIKKYGIIYCDYKHNAYFQEIIRIYTKHIIIFLLYFFNQFNQSILIIFLQMKIYFYEQNRPFALNNLNQLEKESYQLSVFCLTLLFQLIYQSPPITYILLLIINIIFSFKIIKLLIITFNRQNRSLIELFAGRIYEKFPKLKRSNKYEISQQNIQKFKITVSKLMIPKYSFTLLISKTQLKQVEKQN
ncbi:hypothetical protein pb186bvf_008162 [Paramecium bursaria]